MTSEENLKKFLNHLTSVLSKEQIITEQSAIDKELNNRFGFKKEVPAILLPKNREETIAIVEFANQEKVPLYPISKGENYGYGEKLPSEEGVVLLNLNNLDSILEIDPIACHAKVEPGVTQEMLYEYLNTYHPLYQCDVTGANKESSILGNTIDGGFGHTPIGYRRKHIFNMEVLLGSGEILNTSHLPGAGPDLTGLFIQSNFGIVLSITIPIMRKPEVLELCLLGHPHDETLFQSLNEYNILKQREVFNSIIHIGNATRAALTLKPQLEMIDNQKALQLVKMPLSPSNTWTAMASISGTKSEVKAKKKIIKAHFNEYGSTHFFSKSRIQFLKKWGGVLAPHLKHIMNSIGELYNLQAGVPSDYPVDNMNADSAMGYYFIGSTVRAEKKVLGEYLRLITNLYAHGGYSCPITLNFVEPGLILSVTNFLFNKNDPDEVTKAKRFYVDTVEELNKADFPLYRQNILEHKFAFKDKERLEILRFLKKQLDPNGIIAPKRYIY